MTWYWIGWAPKDGSFVRTAQEMGSDGWPIYPLLSRYLDGQWCCDFGGAWAPYEPQPRYWEPRCDQVKHLRRPFQLPQKSLWESIRDVGLRIRNSLRPT